MNKETLKLELIKIKNSLDNLHNNLNSADFEELERKLIISYIEENKKYIVHLCEEVINETFGETVLNNLYGRS
mgnify:CR=1 FL=1